MRQKTPHPKELKAKAHKLFGNKKSDPIQQNGDNLEGPLENEMQETNINEIHNGVGHPSVVFRDGVGTQNTNGNFEDDGDIGDDENEEVSFENLLSILFSFSNLLNDKDILQSTIELFI